MPHNPNHPGEASRSDINNLGSLAAPCLNLLNDSRPHRRYDGS
jgi:hypothetical protein